MQGQVRGLINGQKRECRTLTSFPAVNKPCAMEMLSVAQCVCCEIVKELTSQPGFTQYNYHISTKQMLKLYES